MKTKKNKKSGGGKKKARGAGIKPNTKKSDKHLKRLNRNEKSHGGKFKYSQKKLQSLSLKDRMWEKLKSSRFRYINEQLYNMNGRDALSYFKRNAEEYASYHEGYKKQVDSWPINPLTVVIQSLKKILKQGMVVADFGCGEAVLAKSLLNKEIKVHSFDLVAMDPCVTVCDMAHTPLSDCSVDIAVFCLSLMGVNFSDYIVEANRVLKDNGVLVVAEVESRFDNIDEFINCMARYGFSSCSTNFSYDLFYFLDFKKKRNISKNYKKTLPNLTLKPCLYKKR